MNRDDISTFSTPERAVTSDPSVNDRRIGPIHPLERTIPEAWYTANTFNEELVALRVEKQGLLSSNLALTQYNARLRNEVARAREKVAEYDAKETVDAVERAELAYKIHEQEREIKKLKKRIEQDDKFIKLMTDIGLDEPVFANAQAALDNGQDINGIVVEAIKRAAMDPGSPWHSLLPAITGQRAPQSYISAISLTLEARKELRRARKVSKFWKDLAQEVESNKGIVTPSSSNLKEILETLSEERQAALDDLLGKLKQGNYPRLINELGYSSVTDLAQEETSLPTALQQPPTPVHNRVAPNHSPYVPRLQPLASSSFKEELALMIPSPSPRGPAVIRQRSSLRLLSSSSKRNALGDMDQNRASVECHPSTSVPSLSSISTVFKKPSVKTLSKTRISAGYTTPYHYAPTNIHLDENPVIPESATSDSFANAVFASLVQLESELSAPKTALFDRGNLDSGRSTPFDNSAFERCTGVDRISCTTASSYSVSSSAVAISHSRSINIDERDDALAASQQANQNYHPLWETQAATKLLQDIKEVEGEADIESRTENNGRITRRSSVDRSWSLCEDKSYSSAGTGESSPSTMLTTPTRSRSLVSEKEKENTPVNLQGSSPLRENDRVISKVTSGSPSLSPTKKPKSNSKLPVLRHFRRLSNSLVPNGKTKPAAQLATASKKDASNSASTNIAQTILEPARNPRPRTSKSKLKGARVTKDAERAKSWKAEGMMRKA